MAATSFTSASRDAFWPEGQAAECVLVRSVAALSAKPETTVRFFERGDAYAVHGGDATLIADEFFRTREGLRTLGAGKCGRKARMENGRVEGRSSSRVCVVEPGVNSGAVVHGASNCIPIYFRRMRFSPFNVLQGWLCFTLSLCVVTGHVAALLILTA